MSLFDAFRYDGKRVLVVGGATGMGAATAELVRDAGAEVVDMDFAEVTLDGVSAVHVNMADTGSIDAALEAVGGEFHALFSCAGVADGTPNIEKINFLGHRHMIERMLERSMLPRGSAIGFISSAAGLGWESNLDELVELIDSTDFESGSNWMHEHAKADYFHSKQAICAYVSRRAFAAPAAGHPHQRHLPRPHRHALGAGQQGDVAGLRRRLPRGGRDRAIHRARAGLPTRLPVQQTRPRPSAGSP